MKKITLIFLPMFLSVIYVLLVLFSGGLPTRVIAQDNEEVKQSIRSQLERATPPDYLPNQVIVKYKSYVEDRGQVLKHSGIIEFGQKDITDGAKPASLENTFVVEVRPDEDIKRAVTKLLNNPDVEYAEPDYIAQLWYSPNDSYFSQQWNLKGAIPPSVNAEKAWDLWKGDGATVVSVVDEGIEETHPDLKNQIAAGSDGNTCGPHGTWVAGMVSAQTDNSIGVAAVGFNLKILNKNACNLTYSSLIQKINESVSAGAKVINMSLGGSSDSPTLHNAITNAWNQGVIIVASSGNCGEGCPDSRCGSLNPIMYPAGYTEVIGVAATNSSGTRACFSSKGNFVELTAPGYDVWSTARGGGYQRWSGTSASSPMVAGLAGLLYSLPQYATRSNANAQAIRNILKQTAYDLGSAGYDTANGYGLIDAYAALQAAQGGTPIHTGSPMPSATPLPSATPHPSVSITPTPIQTPTPSVTLIPSVTIVPSPTPGLNCVAADLNNDSQVNQTDLNQLLQNWGGTTPDLNSDKIVNGLDTSIIIACWTG